MEKSVQKPSLAIIGLGYVGLPLAAEFGKKRSVLGFDINAARVAELQAGRDHTFEVSPEELKESAHLRFSADPAALKACSIVRADLILTRWGSICVRRQQSTIVEIRRLGVRSPLAVYRELLINSPQHSTLVR